MVGGAGGGAAGGGQIDGGGGDAGSEGPCDGPEVCGDLVDDNCNGILDDGCECDAGRSCYPNAQGAFFPDGLSSPTLRYPWDGGVGCSPGVQECVGGQLSPTCANPRVPQQESCDGRDNDCDGVVDYPACPCQSGRQCYNGERFTNGVGACRAGVWSCAPTAVCVGEDVGSVEVCDGVDNDCNGLVDDAPVKSVCGPGVCAGLDKLCAAGVEQPCDLSGNPFYSASERCGDSLDNNCNGAVDDGCACRPDAGQSCFTGPVSACPVDGGPCLGVCVRGEQTCLDGGAAWSACVGETKPSTESCSDGLDNDCNGLTDCVDPSCVRRACFLDGGLGNGRTCFQGRCECVHDGGVTTVELCANGIDDDCDGYTDCAQSSCEQRPCGSNGKWCIGQQCTCVPADGGVAQQNEDRCADGIDNDCDGLTDCAEAYCAGLDCGGGRTCRSSVCTCLGPDAGTPQASETLCYDGVDNDCDGLIDWADPSCLHQRCSGASAAWVWCSSDATGCTNLATDSNCGLCGVQCKAGFTCHAVGSVAGVCGCAQDADCPLKQSCNNSRCECSKGSECDLHRCNQVSGTDYCTY